MGKLVRLTSVTLALAALSLVVGCSDSPVDRLVHHLDGMVSVLEENQAAPDKAAEGIEAYVSEHSEELAALKKDLAAKTADMSASDRAKLAEELLLKTGDLMQRAQRVMDENPELARSERLQKALRSLDDLRPAKK